MAGDRTFRIFVSSTFSDMKTERKALQEKVFPELQKLCEINKCTFQAIDLRWGVSEEAALDQQTMNICLTELKRCQEVSPRPNFIILLGNRYGWIPLPPQIEASEFDELHSNIESQDKKDLLLDWYRLDTNAIPPEYILRARRANVFEESDYNSWTATENWLRDIFLKSINSLDWKPDDERRVKYECSATHQEIIEGAQKLPDEREHVFAFFRDIANKGDLPPCSDYIDSGYERVEAMKQDIRDTKGISVFDFSAKWQKGKLEYDLDKFASEVLASLRTIIEEEFQQLEQINDLTKEDLAHKEFGSDRCGHFVGRKAMLNEITGYVRGRSDYPLIVYGPSGSGKSALLAKAASETIEGLKNREDVQIIQRYIGATPLSTDISSLLKNLCEELYSRFKYEDLKQAELANMAKHDQRNKIEEKWSIPDDYTRLSDRFREFVDIVPPASNLILYLDALDQLNSSDNAYVLNWLPQKLKPNVRLVISVLEREDEAGQCLRSAQSMYRIAQMLQVQDMEPSEGREALRERLNDAKRTLTQEQEDSVLSGFAGCPKPLYLQLASEEAKLWKSYDGVLNLADDMPSIVRSMLARLSDKKNHGDVLVRAFLGLLTASRHGLSESEILELLSCKVVMDDLKVRSSKSPETQSVPPVVWLRLYSDLSPYLLERSSDNSTLLNFYHRQLKEIIEQDYADINYNRRLAGYFTEKPLWLSKSQRVSNHRRCTELPYQQTKSEMWDELEATLTDIDFVDAKSKAKMVYDLVNDYNRAMSALPECQEEYEKEQQRQCRIQDYVTKLIAYSSDSDNVPLPNPPPCVEEKPAQPIENRRDQWTRLECMQVWSHFVANHTQWLGNEIPPIYQLAYNSADSGPVVEAVEQHSAPNGVWLKTKNRPSLNTNPVCLGVLEGHTDCVKAVSITPDGKLAISGSQDNTLRLWDLRVGQCLKTLVGHTDYIETVSITPDGRRAISGSYDCTARVWELETGECLRILDGHTDCVKAVSITPDGQRAVSGSYDNTVRVWDLNTGECLKTLEERTNWAITIASDGRRVISKKNIVTRMESTSRGMRFLKLPKDRVSAVSITPDGRRAVSGSSDLALRVWDLETGECLKTLDGHTDDVISVSITSDGRRAVSGSEDNTICVWDLDTGECLKTLLDIHETVSITPDGRLAISGMEDNTLHVWDMETGERLRIMQGHTGSVDAVSITPDGQFAISGSSDYSLRVWNLKLGDCQENLANHLKAISIAPGGRRAVSRSKDNILRVWNLETSECQKILEYQTSRVDAVSITPDSRWAVSGGHDTLCLWDLEIGIPLRTAEIPLISSEAILITPDSRRAVSAGGTLCVWDLETGECLDNLEKSKHWPITASITPDGRWAISFGTVDYALNVWDLETGEYLRTLCGHTDQVEAVSITMDGRRAVSGSYDKTLRVWDLETGECLKILHGHTGIVRAVAIDPGGQRIVSASEDRALRVWDLEAGKCLRTLEGHTNGIGSLCITHDGRSAISGSWDNTMRIWDLETGECCAILDCGGIVYDIDTHSELTVAFTPGKLDFIELQNLGFGPMPITATRLWLHAEKREDVHLTALCPWCGGRFIVQDSWIGNTIACPLKGCGKLLLLNSFICDLSNVQRQSCVVEFTPSDAQVNPPAAEPYSVRFIPRQRTGAERAAQINLKYQQVLAEWNNLPWFKRIKTPKPKPPSGI